MNFKNTALILVGYQNDYFAKDGILRGVIEEPGRVDQVLENTVRLIEALRDTQATIISTPIVLKPDYRALASPVGILHAIKESGAFAFGSPGAETIPEIAAFGDRIRYVTGKVGFNGFSGTQLDEVLKENGITKVMLAGMVTSLCIDSTGRAAYERGYSVTVLSDCTSSRTPTEQEFFCSTVFPLYGSAKTSTDILAEATATA
jgi:nicotinamidase-related amidase